jgi:hypothetical protein
MARVVDKLEHDRIFTDKLGPVCIGTPEAKTALERDVENVVDVVSLQVGYG